MSASNFGAHGAGVMAAEELNGTDGFAQAVAKSRVHSALRAGRDPDPDALAAAEQFASNASLTEGEWRSMDDRMVETAQDALNVVDDLRGRGLTIDTDLGTLIHEFQRTDTFDGWEVDMGAETRGQDEEAGFDLQGVPLPIVHKSFNVNRRQLLASRKTGQPLDTTNVARATRAVSEGLEDMVLNGWNGQVQGETVDGLTTHPDRNVIVGSNWTDDANVGADAIRGDILTAIETLEADNYGPEGTGYIMWVARENYQELRRRDTGTDQERGLLQRVNEELDMLDIRRADHLDPGEAVMLKPISEVIEIAVASDIQTVEWESHETFTNHFKVMASMTPVVKSDRAGQSGIAHLTGLSG